MSRGWMIRAGRGGKFFEQFKEASIAAIGWNALAPLTKFSDKESIKEAYIKHYGNEKPRKTSNAVAMLQKFINISEGDYIVTYSSK